MSNYKIRVEEKRDYLTVEELVRQSFWNVYRPGCTEDFEKFELEFNKRKPLEKLKLPGQLG